MVFPFQDHTLSTSGAKLSAMDVASVRLARGRLAESVGRSTESIADIKAAYEAALPAMTSAENRSDHQHARLSRFIEIALYHSWNLMNAGDLDGAAAEFDRWHIPASITSRRNGEREQFKGTRFEARIP